MKRILIIDNQDSFVYNLVQLVRESPEPPHYDIVSSRALEPNLWASYDALIISPGPGIPEEEPLMMDALASFARAGKPVLGVCLGCQAIAVHFGYSLERLDRPLHGHRSYMVHDGDPLFDGLPREVSIGRYHSWVVDLLSRSDGELIEIGYSFDVDGRQTMALRHRELPIWGVQFHPESMISEGGALYMRNFIRLLS